VLPTGAPTWPPLPSHGAYIIPAATFVELFDEALPQIISGS
jgi:hypothetical protein